MSAFRSALTDERSEVEAQVASLSAQFDDFVESSAFGATDDEHDPDGSTVAFERAKIVALQSQAQGHLEDIAGALQRMENGTFGLCERCGLPIGDARLQARPRSGYCINCAQATPSDLISVFRKRCIPRS